jgi:cation diffusion facilitator family transporter
MICLLAKRFVKDYEKVKVPKVRQGYGIISGATGIAFNIMLFIIKLIAGFISGSISIFGDAFNNLSDAASSVVTLVGFKLSGQEADEEHPFGHGRIEYISGLIVSLFIIIMGVELIHSSAVRIFHPEEIEFDLVIAIILVISIFVKLLMFEGNLRASKVIESTALKSTAMDSISDVFTTTVVLLSAAFAHFTGITIDGYVGVFVGLLIIKGGVEAARDTINPLLGEPPSKELVAEIEKRVMSHESIIGVHDLLIHNYGPGRIFMSLHVEVPSNKDIVTIHDIIDDIENELRREYHCTAVIHMDPVIENDESVNEVRHFVKHALQELDPELKIHDFRIIRTASKGERIAFDVEVPYGYDLKDDDIVDFIVKRIDSIRPFADLDITIDKAKKAKEE